MFHQIDFSESFPTEKINPHKIRSNPQDYNKNDGIEKKTFFQFRVKQSRL